MSGFRLPVKSIFHLSGRGTVFQGDIERGSITVGDQVTVASPENAVLVKVSGIEKTDTHEIVSSAREGEDVSVLVRGFDLAEIDDGIWRQEHEVTPLSVEITRPEAVKRWWQFWK